MQQLLTDFDGFKDFEIEAYWDTLFSTKEKCIEIIESFGFDDTAYYVDLMTAIEDASTDDWVSIPEDLACESETYFMSPEGWDWQQYEKVALITALRYWVAYAYEELQAEEHEVCDRWFATTAPYHKQPFCANFIADERRIP